MTACVSVSVGGGFEMGQVGMKAFGVGRGVFSVVFLMAMLAITPAIAQDNYEAGKTPAQMFATDCALCHKGPAGLSKAPGYFGLESFLREHYTASREAAAKIAAYLRSVDVAQPPRAAGKRRGGEARTKSAKPESKSGGKPGEEKSGGAEPKTEAKTESSAAEKPAEAKPAEPKPAESKPAESKPAEPPASASTPAGRSDKSE
jgi:hypothetical protein